MKELFQVSQPEGRQQHLSGHGFINKYFIMTYKKGANFYDSHEPNKGEKQYRMVNC